MSKSALQIGIVVFFGIALAACLVTVLVYGREQKGLATVTAILTGALILAAVLPQVQEFSIGLKGVQAKLREQQAEINVLKFLVSGYVTHFELTHLQKLANTEPFPYERGDTFIDEMRRLWQLGLVGKVLPNWFFAGLPNSGNLKDYLAITDRGRQYLKLLGQVNADQNPGHD
jgi:hypothetical protein